MSRLILLAVFAVLFVIFLVLLPGLNVPPDITAEGFYQTPGGVVVEDYFALVMIVVGTVITALVAMFITKFYLKGYIRFLGEKKQIGIVDVEHPRGIKHLTSMGFRALFLGFFASNISFTLAAQETIVNWMHDPYTAELAFIIFPDIETMLHLLWIVAIPSTLLFVPVWFMMDVGLISTGKVKGVDFVSADLPTSNVYRILRGYGGLGFAYNLVVTIISLIPIIQQTSASEALILILLVPIMIISFMFPVVILMDSQKDRFRKNLVAILDSLDWKKKFVAEYRLEPLKAADM
ncbi:MAG: hypothetical protein ACFFBD_12115 [Candidatus Hodarchaeota archaeon]